MNSPFTDFKAQEITLEKQEKFFVKPNHIDRLISSKAMFIWGERGSGKTTILRHLEEYFNNSKSLEYIAVYFRFETAYMNGLNNPDMTEEKNIFAFTQSIVAVIAKQLCCVMEKVSAENIKLKNAEASICKEMAEALDAKNIEDTNDFSKLKVHLEKIRRNSLKDLQNEKSICYFDYTTYLNQFCERLRKEKIFENTCFCILLDEYENLTYSQQRVVNSLIKSSSYYLTYKVCMRPEGFLTKDTVAEKEQLIFGHDYEEIDYVKDIIGENEVREHLQQVCAKRLEYFYNCSNVEASQEELDINTYLETITDEKDIESWQRIGEYKESLKKTLVQRYAVCKNEIEEIDRTFDLKLIGILLEKGYDFKEIIKNIKDKTSTYRNWLHNYEKNIVFQIISECEQTKKYCGFEVIVRISNGNTRRVLEILHYAFGDYANNGKCYEKISVTQQTKAVNRVAKDSFEQIMYIPVTGDKIKNLINGLGVIFRNLLQDKRAKKFEVNSFSINTSGILEIKDQHELECVLRDAVVWGALLPFKATKIKNAGDIVLDGRDYMLHPILTPYFHISVRKRQKCELEDYEVYSLLTPKSRSEIRKLSGNIGEEYEQQKLEWLI